MALATLTTKGQVTLPKQVREALNLHQGDKIEIIVTDDNEAVIRPVSNKVDDVFCKLHKPGREAVSIEQMNDIVRQRMKDHFR